MTALCAASLPGAGSLANAAAAVLAQAGQPVKAAEQAAEATGAGGWLVLLAVVGIILMPFLLGWLIARALRLPDVATRVGLVLLALFVGAAPFVWNMVATGSVSEGFRKSLQLGVDLAGGTNLVFQVQETPEKPLTDEVLANMVGSVAKRINPSGTEEVTVRRVGRDRIEVIVPGADPEKVRRIKRNITRLGSLEFAILANKTDHAALIQQAERLPSNKRDLRQGGRIVASWKNVARETGADGKPGDWKQSGPAERYVDAKGEKLANPPQGAPEGVEKQILVVLDRPEQRVTGEYLRNAAPTTEEGRPAVSFTFNAKGGRLFSILTSNNRPSQDGFKRQLSILLDDKIHSAPTIDGVIDTHGVIRGSFTDAEVTDLVGVLNAGALVVPINETPVSEYTISPTLGQDTINKSVAAIVWSGVAVFVFMAAYYLLAGLVADLCLALNIILVLGAMSFIDATFTLPGLAGIVLTIGMAVDANVLIFERIREEADRGSSLRLSIQNGFDRAFSTIIDANVTTLIIAVILYLIGTDAVRGFAVTLFIGILMSMFTALYFGRLVLEIFERKRWVTRLSMNSFLSAPRFDFLGKRIPAMIGSAVLIAVGLAVLFSRGAAMLDIDFLGGTMVTFQLEEPATARQVRDSLEAVPEFKGNISVERLVLSGEPSGEAGKRFRMRTTIQDRLPTDDAAGPAAKAKAPDANGRVSRLVAAAFDKSKLDIRRVAIAVGPITPIPGGTTPGDADAFADGRQAELTFQGQGEEKPELGIDTVAAYVSDQLEAMRSGEQSKYEKAADLVRVVGVAGTGLDGNTSESKTFGKVRVEAAPTVSEADFAAALAGMQARMASEPVFDEVNSFDSSVADEMKEAAAIAILVSWLAIIGYLWFRFQNIAFGVAAVAALVHDTLITLGAVALASYVAGPLGFHFLGLEEFKINLPMIAAIMTLIGYSINDTIVVFDRIREVRGKNPALNEGIVNASLNQTLSRTLLTALTTFLVVMILYAFGGEGIHGFAFVLVFGIIVGTYSSIYIACPILLWLVNRGTGGPAKTLPATSAVAAR